MSIRRMKGCRICRFELIPDDLFVPNSDQNLLSVGQLLEKGFKVLFEDKFSCQYGKQSRLPFPRNLQGDHHTSCNLYTLMLEDLREHLSKGYYVPQVKRDKLDKKAKAGIFERYNNQSKTYRVYMPHADKVIVGYNKDAASFSCSKGLENLSLDVKSTFLIGYLEEEIFVEQPEGLAVKDKEDKVYQLKKALYGLKQAPELGSNQCLMDKFKAKMEKVFEMTDLGDMYYFLGMEVHQNQHEIFICQQKYAKEILKKFKM
ncbi:Retrovirus-related Pol polyprotein from transposon TNT 1-94 [Vitis vinifera]|uniref:Retrovirus-related Pol polyprotein from transposon TNT 1-94 n=1 Tax=Vitis vinifera TaxID=29760 RepID=A0A438C5W8_VITVI|nr:Retrovirus-related Pol polyprotein from transposon TNT 1-94 [Vitis vinifera]